MQFQQAVATVFRKYAVFTGRASRSEYWYFVLFNVVVSAVFSFLGLLFGGSDGPAGWVMVLSYIYGLATLLPGLGVSVRRMHDIGKGGGWIFINLVPLIGTIWFIVLAATAGEPVPNRFGAPED